VSLENRVIQYASSGDTHIAYTVVGDGPVDPVWSAGGVTNVERLDGDTIVDPASGSDEFTVPRMGKHFVAVQLRVTNSGTVPYRDSNAFTTRVLDVHGQSFSADLSSPTTAGPAFANGGVDEIPGATELGTGEWLVSP
jgi:hypothetical protein